MAGADSQQPYNDEFARIINNQAAHDARLAEQAEYDDRFRQVVDPDGLGVLGRRTRNSAESLRDHGETTAMEILDPDPHDDAALTRLAAREAKIRQWTAKAVELGEDADEAEARIRQTLADADAQLADNMRNRYEAYARHIENLGAQTAASLTPRENKMRNIIQRAGRFLGNLFDFRS